MIAIDLPWPPRVLHPNARSHWSKRASAAKQCRLTAFALTKLAGIRKGDPDIPNALNVTVTFFPPDRKARDRDNLLANCKAYFDGIADVLGMNDSAWDFSTRAGEVVKGGYVRVELSAAPNDFIAKAAIEWRNERRTAHIDAIVERVTNRDMGHGRTSAIPDQELDPVSALQGQVAGVD